jgi:hypothetical protein|tara:strand:- start:2583 stop:2828 length:246 start_codon:yes stop_codon:yes gene_type:complete
VRAEHTVHVYCRARPQALLVDEIERERVEWYSGSKGAKKRARKKGAKKGRKKGREKWRHPVMHGQNRLWHMKSAVAYGRAA